MATIQIIYVRLFNCHHHIVTFTENNCIYVNRY